MDSQRGSEDSHDYSAEAIRGQKMEKEIEELSKYKYIQYIPQGMDEEKMRLEKLFQKF